MITKRKYPDKCIIGIKPYTNNTGDDYLNTVLAYLPTNRITPYVTWIYNIEDKGFFWGHYHQRINDAIPEFLMRGSGSCSITSVMIKCYDAIECHYVVRIDDNTWDQCEAENAQMISVYLHKPEGGIECISDHYDPKDAMRIVRWISNKYELPIGYQPKDVHYINLQPIIE